MNINKEKAYIIEKSDERGYGTFNITLRPNITDKNEYKKQPKKL